MKSSNNDGRSYSDDEVRRGVCGSDFVLPDFANIIDAPVTGLRD